MTARDILDAAASACATDAALAAFCQETYGKALTVYVGVDGLAPPENDAYPLAALVGIRRATTDRAGFVRWELDAAAAVVQEAVDRTENLVTYRGFLEVEELRGLVEQAVRRARFAKVLSDGESSQLELFPAFCSFTTLILETVNTSRRQS